MVGSLLCNFVGEARASGNRAMATDVAISLGMGRGEFAGSLSSMRALCAMVIPLLYSQLFDLGQRLNVPGLHFFGVLLFTLAKDLMERSLPAELKR